MKPASNAKHDEHADFKNGIIGGLREALEINNEVYEELPEYRAEIENIINNVFNSINSKLNKRLKEINK
jgi:hypothetical protein